MMILQQLDLARSSICLATIIVVSFLETAVSQQPERVNVCGGNGPPSNVQLNENVAAGTVVLKNKVIAGGWWEFQRKNVVPSTIQNRSLVEWASSILKFRPVEMQNSSRCGFSGSGNESFCELYASKSIDFEQILAEFHEGLVYFSVVLDMKCLNGQSQEVPYEVTVRFNSIDEYPTTFPSASVNVSLPLRNMTAGQTIFTLVPKDDDSLSADSKLEFLQEVTFAPLDELFQFVNGAIRMLLDAGADDFPGNTPRVYTLTKGSATMTIYIRMAAEDSSVTGSILVSGESGNNSILTSNTTQDPVGADDNAEATEMSSSGVMSIAGLAVLGFIACMAVVMFLRQGGSSNTPTPKPAVRQTTPNQPPYDARRFSVQSDSTVDGDSSQAEDDDDDDDG